MRALFCVALFALIGPIVGGLTFIGLLHPAAVGFYVLYFFFSVPYSYVLGGVPALLTGLLVSLATASCRSLDCAS
jgi:hypothetical protein